MGQLDAAIRGRSEGVALARILSTETPQKGHSMLIQHADFEMDPLDDGSPADIFASLMSVDWPDEARRFTERWLLQQECCPPGFYMHRPGGEYLAIYPASRSRFILNFCLVSGHTTRGKEQLREMTLLPVEPERVRALIEAFVTVDSNELIQQLDSEELADPGVISSEKTGERHWMSTDLRELALRGLRWLTEPKKEQDRR